MVDPCQSSAVLCSRQNTQVKLTSFSEPIARLHAEVPDFVFRALLTHRQHRIESTNTESINGPVPGAVFLIFSVKLITPVVIDLVIKMQFGIFQIGP